MEEMLVRAGKLGAESQRGEVPPLSASGVLLVLLLGQGGWLVVFGGACFLPECKHVLGGLLSCKVLPFPMCTLHRKMVKDQQVIDKGTHRLLLSAFSSLHPTPLLR